MRLIRISNIQEDWLPRGQKLLRRGIRCQLASVRSSSPSYPGERGLRKMQNTIQVIHQFLEGDGR